MLRYRLGTSMQVIRRMHARSEGPASSHCDDTPKSWRATESSYADPLGLYTNPGKPELNRWRGGS
jgi:hypothetical protein